MVTREGAATNGVIAVYSHATGIPPAEDASGSEGRSVASLRSSSQRLRKPTHSQDSATASVECQ